MLVAWSIWTISFSKSSEATRSNHKYIEHDWKKSKRIKLGPHDWSQESQGLKNMYGNFEYLDVNKIATQT